MVLKVTLLLLSVAGVCLADPVIYTIQGFADGSVGATDFSDVAFALSVTTDTTLVTSVAFEDGDLGYETPAISGASISIDTIGTGTFTNTEQIFVDNTIGEVGITDGVAGDLLDGYNTSTFETTPYDLQSSIGPVQLTDIEAILQFFNIPTSLGLVTFENVTFTSPDQPVFFSAAVGTTPEPGTLLLGLAGALLLAGFKLRTRAG